MRRDLLVYAALEIAIAGQHRRDNQVRSRQPRPPPASGNGPLIADAGRAAVADGVEAELPPDTPVKPDLSR